MAHIGLAGSVYKNKIKKISNMTSWPSIDGD